MNHGGGFYITIFPMENIIIIFWTVALKSVGNFRRYLIDSRTKNFKNLSIFFEVRRQIRFKLCARARVHWFCRIHR
jgi:hypothetical protein